MASTLLGFVEEFDKSLDFSMANGTVSHLKARDCISDFPHKVGGTPLWINRKQLLKADQVTCGVCTSIMPLLLQIYQPSETLEQAFHRVIYLFACKNGACHKKSWKDCFKCFRSQLPEFNPFWNEDVPPPPLSAQCQVCGLAGTKKCGSCKLVSYCSKEHQVLDWQAGGHKQTCKDAGSSSIASSARSAVAKMALFFELEIVTEPEPDVKAKDKVLEETKKVEVAKAMEVKEGDEKDFDMEETQVEVDEAFLEFQRLLEAEPQQVLRLCKLEDDSTDLEPLWAATEGQLKSAPPCANCQSPRTFDFQIMPQLLTYLGIDDRSPDALDWGTVVVYTCAKSCSPADNSDNHYLEEVVHAQPFSAAGMGDEARKKAHEAAMAAAAKEGDEE